MRGGEEKTEKDRKVSTQSSLGKVPGSAWVKQWPGLPETINVFPKAAKTLLYSLLGILRSSSESSVQETSTISYVITSHCIRSITFFITKSPFHQKW